MSEQQSGKQPRDDDNAGASSQDWLERATDVAAAFGFNRVRVRWRLERLRQRWNTGRQRSKERAATIGYRHKMCSTCGGLNDGAASVCYKCQRPMAARRWHVLERAGLSLPHGARISHLLGLALIIIFVRMMIYEQASALFSFQIRTLFIFGGHWPPAVAQGQWWRWGTAVFLHAGLWHLGFNVFALAQVGPLVEDLFGRARTLWFFVLTGVVGSMGSAVWGLSGIGIGASGAIMGLCGLAAAWGHRDGTSIGHNVRGVMIKWALYTMVFGMFIGADNAAHFFGFASGAVLGLLAQPLRASKPVDMRWRVVQGALGAASAIALVLLVLLAPQLQDLLGTTAMLP